MFNLNWKALGKPYGNQNIRLPNNDFRILTRAPHYKYPSVNIENANEMITFGTIRIYV